MKNNLPAQGIAAVFAAILFAGALPGAAFAQNGHGDHQDGQRDRRQHDQGQDRRHQNDHDNRGDRNNRGNNGNRDDRDNRYGDRRHEDDNHQKTKNDWRNLATVAGGAAVLGILKKDPTITFAGAAGALYSMNRYEQDRKSQSKNDRARAGIFAQPYVYRDGQRYERRTVNQNGQKYYRFVKP